MSNIYNEENCTVSYCVQIQEMKMYFNDHENRMYFDIIGHTLNGTRLPNHYYCPAELFHGVSLPIESRWLTIKTDDNYQNIVTAIQDY